MHYSTALDNPPFLPGSIGILLIFIVCLTSISVAQGQNKNSLGLELQFYPTGVIPGIRYTRNLSQHVDIHLRIGTNIIDHRDQGEQDNEEGHGYGFTPGVRYFIKAGENKWFWDIRTDIWFNSIDWQNAEPVGNLGTSGTSDITVIQPTLSIGYMFLLKDHWFLSPAVSFGVEYNVRTVGADIGDGVIGLIGVELGKRF